MEWKGLRRVGEGRGRGSFLRGREGGRGGVCVVFVEYKVIWYNWYWVMQKGTKRVW